MAKPTNLDEYYQKMLVVRDQLKSFMNGISPEAEDLEDVTRDDLAAWGLDAAKQTYEMTRLAAAGAVTHALGEFDDASV